MYIISFDTFKITKNISTWEDKLFNDFHSKLNSITYEYKSFSKALERLNFILGRYSNVIDNKDSYFTLSNALYGIQNRAIKLYGIPQGYVDIEKELSKAKEYGVVKIRLSDFYDTRQNINYLKKGYLIIKYIAT